MEPFSRVHFFQIQITLYSKLPILLYCDLTMDMGMSEYELVRLENIRKNEEFLKALGLFNGSNGRTINKNGEGITTTTTARRIVRDKEKRKHRQVKIDRSDDDNDAAPVVVRLTRSKRKVTDTTLEGTVMDTSTDKENNNIDTVHMRGRHKAKHDDNDDADADIDDGDDDGEVMTRFSHADLESYLSTINSEHVDQLSDEVMMIYNTSAAIPFY